MTLDLFACIPIRDLESSRAWYEQLHAGHATHTVFASDFDERLAQIAERGLEPAERETYENGVRKAIFRDPDGNLLSFGGGPVE